MAQVWNYLHRNLCWLNMYLIHGDARFCVSTKWRLIKNDATKGSVRGCENTITHYLLASYSATDRSQACAFQNL